MTKIPFSIFLLLLIIIIAAFFRFYKFEQIPFGLNHDGAQDALQSIFLIEDLPNYHPYLPGGSGETLFKYYLGLMVKYFGININTIKFASTLICFLTVPFFYFLVKEISDRKLALFSTFLLAISGWHIIMGRTVWRAITTPFFEIITLLTLFKAIHQKNYFYYLLSGIFLGLTLNTYNGARSVVVFCFLFFLYFFIAKIFSKKLTRQDLIGFCIFVVSFTVISIPLIKYSVNNWAEFNSRLDSLSVLNKVKNTQNLMPLWKNIKSSFLIFNINANGNDFFTSQPLLDFPVSILFLIGSFFCFLKIKKSFFQFLILGILINLLPGFFSEPNGNRNIATMPFVYIIAGVGFKELWQFVYNKFSLKMASFILVTIICFTGLLYTYNLYFGKNRREIWGFYPETTIVGNFMKDELDDYDFYLADNYPRDTLTFLTYKGGNPFVRHYTWFENKNSFFYINKNKNKGLCFIMFNLPENYALLGNLKQKYPNGLSYELQYKDDVVNRPAALVFQVSKDENQ